MRHFLLLLALPATLASAAIITPSTRLPEAGTWESAGRTGGIPARDQTVFADVTDAPYSATGDGVTDDSAAIQACIDACPEGQVVFFPPGTYYCGSAYIYARKPVVLRGAGPTQSIIRTNHSSYNGALQIGASSNAIAGPFTSQYIDGYATDITAGSTRGSTQISVSSTAPGGQNFVVGNWLMVAGENPDVVNTNRDQNDGYELSPSAGYITKITAIAGNDITLADPLPWTYTVGTAYPTPTGLPQAVCYNKNADEVVNFTEDVGVEDLAVEGNGTNRVGVKFRISANCWMDNCSISRFDEHNMMVSVSAHVTVHGSYIHHTGGSGSGGGYGITFEGKSTRCLIENNRLHSLSGHVHIDDGGSGNVVAYNYCSPMDTYYQANHQQAQLTHHKAHPMWTLYEGNYTANIVGDDIHGSNSHTTAFRNRVHGAEPGKTQHLHGIIFVRNSSYLNAVGNVIGTGGTHTEYQLDASTPTRPTPYLAYGAIYALGWANYHYATEGDDQNTANTAYKHGNYDVVNDAVVWDAGNADHTIPDSLYLSEKPSWWGALAWPPYDPATPGANGPELIPAGYLYLNAEAAAHSKRGKTRAARSRGVLSQ